MISPIRFTIVLILWFVAIMLSFAFILWFYLDIPTGFWLILLGGAFGGFVRGLTKNNNRLVLAQFPNSPTKSNGFPSIQLGIMGDMVVGMGGAATLGFLFSLNLLQVDVAGKDAKSVFTLFSLSFISGTVAHRLIQIVGETLIDRVSKAEKEAQESKEETQKTSALMDILSARFLYDDDPKAALGHAINALEREPANARAMFEKARILKKIGLGIDSLEKREEYLQEAVSLLSAAVKLRPKVGSIWFNLACYEALVGFDTYDSSVILGHLGKAIKFDSSLIKEAREDTDLNELREKYKSGFEELLAQESED